MKTEALLNTTLRLIRYLAPVIATAIIIGTPFWRWAINMESRIRSLENMTSTLVTIKCLETNKVDNFALLTLKCPQILKNGIVQ